MPRHGLPGRTERRHGLATLRPIPKVFEKVARLLAGYEPVRMIASGSVLEEARSSIGSVSNIELVDIPTNDAWLRDTGPVFLLPPDGQEPLAVAWKWNAWGGKYPPWDADAKVACAIARRLQMNVVEPDVVLEGGDRDRWRRDAVGELSMYRRPVSQSGPVAHVS